MATTQPIEDARMAMIEAARSTDPTDPYLEEPYEGAATIRALAILFTLAGHDKGRTPPRMYARDVASYINDAILEYGNLVAPDDVDENHRVVAQIWEALAERASEVLPNLRRMVTAEDGS